MIQTDFRQNHFVLYEIILPYCTSCTPSNDLTEAWHTPVTCEESSDDEYSLWFCTSAAPGSISQPTPSINRRSVLNSKVFRCVVNGSESTAKLKAGQGLASRGTMTVKCDDFDGDPGPINFSDGGTFFGKLLARNILEGKKIISHYYSIPSSSATPVEVYTSTHFITNTQLTGGVFTIQAKDALKDLEAFSEQFPEPSSVTLTADIDTSTTTIPASDVSDFVAGSVFRIDDELFYVNSVSGSNLIVAARGTTLNAGDGTTVYKTNVSSHTTDSTIQPCYVMSQRFLSNVLSDIFTAVGLGAYIDFAQWDAEIQEWNSNAFLYGVFSEPEKVSDLIDRLLGSYIIDMWLDQPSQLVRVNAVSSWKESIRTIQEGNDLTNLKISKADNTRFSRAYVYNKKDFKAENDDITNYSKLTLFTDTETEDSDFYGSIKVKEFEPNDFISTASAQILCSRWVQRYAETPKDITFTMEERKLANTQIGDIVDIITRDSQTPSGEFLQARDRAQILRIQPVLNKIGRQYKVTAQSYIPLISSDPGQELVITLSGTLFDVNLFARAGAPNVAVNVTFVFDAATIGSTASNVPSVRAGNFEAGSRVRIICINDTKWSAKGGDGAVISAITTQQLTGSLSVESQANSGADSYVSDGVESEIYLNYSAHGYSASSELFASGGAGGSGAAIAVTAVFNQTCAAITPGGGGSGIPGGNASKINYSFLSGLFGGSSGVQAGVDGTFSSGGNGNNDRNYQRITGSAGSGVFVECSASSASGGTSSDASDGSSLINSSGGAVIYYGDKLATKGTDSGGAIKGSNVTVYNLAASASKFRPGNSDSYTLIDS